MTILGNHALVSGGGTGVGRSIALALAEAGASVTICGRRMEPLQSVASIHPNIRGIVADVTDEASMGRLYEQAQADSGPIDIVVSNAGVSSGAPALKTKLDDWQHMLNVNLTGAFLTVRPALAGMMEKGKGRVVFVASTAGLKGYSYVAPYVASKHGVIGLMRSLAVELASTSVTVNAVCPGFVETEMLAESVDRIVAKTGRTASDARASLMQTNPQQRFIQPDEVASTVVWLCSQGAGSITGQAISVSGGETW